MHRQLRLLALLLLSLPIQAEQLEFNRIKQGEQTLLSWVWKDSQGEQHYLKASINTETLLSSTRDIRKFKPRHFNEYKVIAARKAAPELPAGMHLRLIHSGHTFVAEITGGAPKERAIAQEKFNQHITAEANRYLKERSLMSFRDAHGELNVIPNHTELIHKEITLIHPLMEHLRKQVRLLPPHLAIDRILSFVQVIPEEPFNIEGSNYRSPLATLLDNKGDSTSKATLAATMIRALYPQRKLALFYTESQTMLGVQINYDVPGKTYYDGKQLWLCAEVAPQKPLALGRVSRKTEQELNSQAIKITVVP